MKTNKNVPFMNVKLDCIIIRGHKVTGNVQEISLS